MKSSVTSSVPLFSDFPKFGSLGLSHLLLMLSFTCEGVTWGIRKGSILLNIIIQNVHARQKNWNIAGIQTHVSINCSYCSVLELLYSYMYVGWRCVGAKEWIRFP